MVYCTKQQEICQKLQRSDVATGNARWPTQRTTHNAAMRCTKDPKIEKNQDFAPGLKLSSDQSQIEFFNRDWKFQARLKIRLLLWGIIKVGIEIFKRDWNFQSRLKFSISDWNFQAYGLKISRDQSGLKFFNRRALWVLQPDWKFVSLGQA